jgi:hypothetical protein
VITWAGLAFGASAVYGEGSCSSNHRTWGMLKREIGLTRHVSTDKSYARGLAAVGSGFADRPAR